MSWFQMILEKLKTAKCFNSLQALREERGAIFVLTAILLPLLLGCLGFAYDAGNLYIHKARLQNTADAAALAGGRAYVNALSEYATNGVVSSAIDETIKTEAKGTMKSSAQQYIRVNNPLFAGKSGKDEKFWFGIKSISGTNSTEYFRVNLTEPVQLYFLPVIGIQKSVDVKAYATTKLTDTVVSGEGNNQQVDAENRPVVIAGSVFFDEINTNDMNNPSNFYNTSTVYVQEGGSITGIDIVHEGKTKHVVPSSEGDIIINGRRYAEVVETKYDMAAFGESIKQRFREKQEASLTQEDKDKIAVYLADKQKWDAGQTAYHAAYETWKTNAIAGGYYFSNDLEKAQYIYQKFSAYIALFNENYNYDWSKREAAYQIVYNRWVNVDNRQPYTKDDNSFRSLILDNSWKFNADPSTNWEYNYKSVYEGLYNDFGLGVGVPEPNVLDYMDGLTQEPQATDPKYNIPTQALDEYYMTYHGSINKISTLYTLDISTNPVDYGLKSDEHSYLYISRAALNPPTTDGNISEINVNGFYISPTPTTDNPVITGDTPYYIFIDADMNQRVNVKVTANCNRPLVLCYLGTTPVHYEFNANLNVRGIFYSPYAGNDTLVNGTANNVTFSGSIISDYLKIQSHNTAFQYNPEEIKKWQDSSEGLPSTPNVGFTSSSGSGNTGGTTNKITLTDRLRLFLAGNTNQNNYYNPDDGSWDWTPL